MKKMLVVASLLGSMMLASPQFVTPVWAQALGELCWNIQPVSDPFWDRSRLRLAITKSGTTWLLSGRWNYFTGSELCCFGGFWTASVAVSGVMAWHLSEVGFNTNMLDISLIGHNYLEDPGSDYRFHARINSETGNGTFTKVSPNGAAANGTLTVVPLSSCP